MALSITSLLQTESLDPAAQSKQLFEDTFRQYARDFPVQAIDEPTLAFIKRFNLHCISFAVAFVSHTTDEKFLQSTGNLIANQSYGDKRNGMGILEEATKHRRQLREMRETMQEAQRLIKQSVTPTPRLTDRTIPESVQQFAPSDSSSRSSISVATGYFSAAPSQPSTTPSQAFSNERLSMSPNPSSACHDVMSISSNIHSTQNHDIMALNSAQMHNDDESDDSNDDDYMNSADEEPEATREWSYEALKHRGKGRYICPEWRTCTKGGNNGHGSPKIFKRNCMFRQHLQKHDKPHKCLLRGCPNKEGFARKDQLVRHQQNVKHDEPPQQTRPPYHTRRL